MTPRSVILLLRFGLAFVFAYAAISSFINPFNWIGYFSSFMRSLLPENLLLIGFSITELFLAVWLVSGKYAVWAALLAFAMLAGITVFNLHVLDVTFRDVGLACAALALYFAAKSEKQANLGN